MPGAFKITGFNFETIDGSLRDGAAAQVSRSSAAGVGFGVGFRKNSQVSLCGSVLPLTHTTPRHITLWLGAKGFRWVFSGLGWVGAMGQFRAGVNIRAMAVPICQIFVAISWREANETAIQESPFIATDSSQTRMDACLCP